jgi:hypothetical protein
MTIMKIAAAAVLASALAAPAMAANWEYHGGPKSPDSLTWPTYGYSDHYVRAYPGPAYGYYGYARPDTGWYGYRD